MLNVESIIQSGGLLLVGLIVFAESGLLIGFFLPGDTLLFTAGFFASQDKLPLVELLAIIMVAAIVGDQVGYHIGKKAGPRIFKKKDSRWFKHEHLMRAEEFYEKHGGKTIIIARFTPFVRTFAPVVAGAANMPKAKFTFFNIIGAIGWALSVTLLGYWLGNRISNIDKYLLPIVLLATLFTFGLPLIHVWRDRQKEKL